MSDQSPSLQLSPPSLLPVVNFQTCFFFFFFSNLRSANYKVGDSSASSEPSTPPPAPAASASATPAAAPAGNYPPYEVIDLPALSPTMEQDPVLNYLNSNEFKCQKAL